MEVWASAATITIHAAFAGPDGTTLRATRQRAVGRGARIVDEADGDGLPDGHPRAVITGNTSGDPAEPPASARRSAGRDCGWDHCKPCSTTPPRRSLCRPGR